MSKNNSTFLAPKDSSAPIWKYLDVTKFLSLLEERSLYFARSDALIDPCEGTLPQSKEKNVKCKNLRKYVFLNCWHQNDHESAAMWDIYLKSNEGLAICSTFERLSGCFTEGNEHNVHIGTIKYIDYLNEKIDPSDDLAPFMHKRKSFEYENEIRALVYHPDEVIKRGFFVPIDIDRLVDKIYVAPTAENWVHDLIKSLVAKYSLDKEVIKSEIYDRQVT